MILAVKKTTVSSALSISISVMWLLLQLLFVVMLSGSSSNKILVAKAMTMTTSSSLKIRVCTGSGCLGKCRGGFNPLTSLEKLLISDDNDNDYDNDSINDNAKDTAIEIEETFCMNQCKRGPNVRIINADNGNVITFDESIMNEVESTRKNFQRIIDENRVIGLWVIVNGIRDGTVVGVEKGQVDILNDIMPTIKPKI
jgi:(2Fe-2S) ferredoxin